MFDDNKPHHKETKEEKTMRHNAEEQAEAEVEAKKKFDSENHDVVPEAVIGQRPTRVILEYPDGHALQVDGDNIVDYQGLAPAGSDPYKGSVQLRLNVSTAQYKPRTLNDIVAPAAETKSKSK